MEEDSGGPAGAFGSEAGLRRAGAGVKMARLTMEMPEALAAPAPVRTDADDDQLAKLLAERDELNRQHAALLAQIRQHDPEFAPDQPVAPVSFAQAQALLPADVPTAIVQFTLTRERGLALVITGNDILKVPIPDLAEQQGWELANEWLRNYYEGRDGDTAAWMRRWEQVLPGLLRGVAAKALQPVMNRIQGLGLRRLVLVPHRALHLFPLHACPLADGSLLTDHFEIVYAPSLSLLHRCASRPRPEREQLLLVQNPTGDLAYSEVEGRGLQRLYGSSCLALERGRATKESIFKHAETAHVTHYTGHSYFHPKEPLQSALILEGLSEQASSRWLRLRDAFTRLDLRRNRLAILNGCESGVLFPDPVDEYVNLPTGFLYAGAACVISTLWPVWDLSSALLMVRFHQIWKEDGRSDRIATALRQAQAWLRREIRSGPQLRDEVLPAFLKSVEDEDLRRKCVAAADEYARRFPDRPPFAHPIYWAPFICSGLGYPLARP
ncbi:MAG: CHAT domain-containing protein [Verrucomicrobiota bacterium]